MSNTRNLVTDSERSNAELPVNIIHTLAVRDCSLNIDRTLKKENKVKVEHEGGVEGTMDTAAFELFSAACRKFSSHRPEWE